MDNEKIGKFIKEIRTKEKLSQKSFADKYGVTYQAVSKWENGKNIPDLAILKQMCSDYNIDLNSFLETKMPLKKNNKKKIIIIAIIILIALGGIVTSFIFLHQDKTNFEFKTLSSSCSNFKLEGSLAYNKRKSAIYISKIIYCGETDDNKYQQIECNLYEQNGDTKTKISTYKSSLENITLEEFLSSVTFKVDDYDNTCAVYEDNNLYLEINASLNSDKMITYKVPLKPNDNC